MPVLQQETIGENKNEWQLIILLFEAKFSKSLHHRIFASFQKSIL